MQIGTYVDGRPLNYDYATQVLDVGGTVVSSQQVVEYDAARQIAWLSQDLRELVYLRAAEPNPVVAPVPPSPAPTASAPAPRVPLSDGWFGRQNTAVQALFFCFYPVSIPYAIWAASKGGRFRHLPLWAKVLFVLFYPVSITYGVWVIWKDKRYTLPVRMGITAVVCAFVLLFAYRVATLPPSESAAAPAPSTPVAAAPAPAPVPSAPIATSTVSEPASAPAPVAPPAPAVAPKPRKRMFEDKTKYAFDSPEWVLTEYHEAWRDKDWRHMAMMAQTTWRLNESNAAGTLKDMHYGLDLVGFELISMDPGGENAMDATFIVWIKTDKIRAYNSSARLIRESGVYEPSEFGTWGVNPISAMGRFEF